MMSKSFDDDSGHSTSWRVFAGRSGFVVPYEQQLAGDLRFAMREGDRFFRETNGSHKTLRRITGRLNELAIAYAVVGGMAVFRHGLRQFTQDVDILVTVEGLTRIHEALRGREWVPPSSRSKNLRDSETGVKVKFLITGQYPGDEKPKPIAFPEPASVAIDIGGIKYVNLPTLVNLKLASGMTNPARLKDLGDVQELIKALSLTADYANELDPFVKADFLRLWQGVEDNRDVLEA